MKRGFTILELLVASLLLGMLLSILTMIFNQSSIAWRTGLAGVAEMNDVRTGVGKVRDEADNIFFHGTQEYRIVSPWKMDGTLRTRACNENDTTEDGKIEFLNVSASADPLNYSLQTFSGANSSTRKSYTVGVMSCGPDGKADTYDDITTWPDEVRE